jgi:DNA-directed RNA polymerase beta subunit
MEQIEPLKTKICKACLIERTIKNYNKNTSFSDGFESRCKTCKKNGNLIVFKSDGKWSKKKHKIKRSDYILPFTNPMKRDYVEAFVFLRAMGYDLTQDIHIQFCKKYGLTPNDPKQTFQTIFTVKDCYLI